MTTVKKVYENIQPYLRQPSGKPDHDAPFPDHKGRIWSFCPIHADGTKRNNRSLSLHPVFGIKCFAGCDSRDIWRALMQQGNGNSSPQVKQASTASIGAPSAVYLYTDAAGSFVAKKARWNLATGKTFRWSTDKDGNTWNGLKGLSEASLPLYRADSISRTVSTVYFVEGEKAADECVKQGLEATCLAGGASTQEFGDCLELLRGKTVVLWPDNDAPGRQLMLRLSSHLRDIANHLSWAMPTKNLPIKGDAYDYFVKMLGTADELKASNISEPIVQHIDRDAIRVTHPASGQRFVFEASRINKSRAVFECEFKISTNDARYVQRINLLSSSSVTDLRRTLNEIFGKEHDWPRLLASVVNLVITNYSNADRSEDVTDIEVPEGDMFLASPLLPLDAPTVVFGDGGSSKSYLAL